MHKKPLIILQARTNSSRLPGKSLLTIAHRPIAVLSAQRLSNSGLQTIVAISDDHRDDCLEAELRFYNLNVFRGSLQNPFLRYKSLIQEMNNLEVVVRATADNVFPDGELCESLFSEFIDSGLRYMQINGKPSGVPNGLRLEFFYARDLLSIDVKNLTEFECEHVTPRLISMYGSNYIKKFYEMNCGHLSATIDTFNDYIKIAKLFISIDDPVNISWQTLIERLKNV